MFIIWQIIEDTLAKLTHFYYSKLHIWNIGSSQCEFELDEGMLLSFDYVTHGDRLQVITGHIDNPVRVRDHQERTHY